MNLSAEELALVAAARNRERGALRTLAVSLDERLGDDVCLDGAVMAWRAVKGSSRRSSPRSFRSMAGVLKGPAFLRWRFAGAQSVPASAPPVPLPKPANSPQVQDHRPAA